MAYTMQCQHSDGGYCISCDEGVNYCCGDDKRCERCENPICYNCYNEKGCEVCSMKVILPEDLLHFLLDKYELTLEEAEDEYRKKALGDKA